MSEQRTQSEKGAGIAPPFSINHLSVSPRASNTTLPFARIHSTMTPRASGHRPSESTTQFFSGTILNLEVCTQIEMVRAIRTQREERDHRQLVKACETYRYS
jgi:hypothetical protein